MRPDEGRNVGPTPRPASLVVGARGAMPNTSSQSAVHVQRILGIDRPAEGIDAEAPVIDGVVPGRRSLSPVTRARGAARGRRELADARLRSHLDAPHDRGAGRGDKAVPGTPVPRLAL